METERIILGIDPGTQLLGFDVIKSVGKKAEYVDMGVLDAAKIAQGGTCFATLYYHSPDLVQPI